MGAGKDLLKQTEAFYAKLDYTGLTSLYASDAILTDPTGRYEGREAIRAYFQAGDKPFSDVTIENSRMIEEGDTVVAEWTWRGTHTGPLPMPDGTELPATGRTIENPGVSIFTVRDGKIAVEHDFFDNAAMMSQLGLLPGT